MTEPRFLLIVRERLRSESQDAYSENEIRIAAACATLNCPHPYLALVSVDDPTDVWWVNAFATVEERDGIAGAYARNEPLMRVLGPLGKRKEDFRETLTTVALTRRPDVDSRTALQIAGARYVVVDRMKDQKTSWGAATFDAADGQYFAIAAVATRAAADEAAGRFDPPATILAVEPRWSFPAETWVRSDPEFWRSSPAAKIRRWI